MEKENATKLDVLNDLFPEHPDYLVPIIPKNTNFIKPTISLNAPDSLYKGNPYQDKILVQPDKRIGSNNWAIDGSRTIS